MKIPLSPRMPVTICCVILFAPVLVAQTTIQLFGPVDTRPSNTSASYAAPDTFSSTTLQLNCSVSPIAATLSGPLMNPQGTAPQLNSSGALQPGGNLLVDNNVFVSITTPTAGGGGIGTNVCKGGFDQGATYNGLPVPPSLSQSCFKSGAYATYANQNLLNGDDPDTYVLPSPYSETVDATGGVSPIDISPNLAAGSQSATIALKDEGGWLTSSSLFLTTNCTQAGVTGPAQVSGNPISPTNPTPAQLTQTFNFNTGTGQQVGFVYDLSGAETANTLTINSNEPIPHAADSPVDPAKFQPLYAAGTSFATSTCLVHTGELLSNGSPACKLYTLECTLGTGTAASGAQCPVSTVENEVVKDIFDGPAFSMQNIVTPGGGVPFHEGIGFLMASEGWIGGPCTFDPASGLQDLPCPQNLLDSFTGPGVFSSIGETSHPNSSFISVYGVPEDLTSVSATGELPGYWINSRTAHVQFFSQPPNLTQSKLPGAADFIPSPIRSITYGVAAEDSEPTPAEEPIADDITLSNAAADCSVHPTATVAPNFAPAQQTVKFSADGQYLLHYYAQDCAGTQELLFTQTAGSWSTNFYSYPINVDTVPPVVTFSNPALTPAGPYTMGEVVYASYACTDQTSDTTPGSGVILCGSNVYAPSSTYNTGTLKTQVNTSSAGTKTFVVNAEDGAGNRSSASIVYTVAK